MPGAHPRNRSIGASEAAITEPDQLGTFHGDELVTSHFREPPKLQMDVESPLLSSFFLEVSFSILAMSLWKKQSGLMIIELINRINLKLLSEVPPLWTYRKTKNDLSKQNELSILEANHSVNYGSPAQFGGGSGTGGSSIMVNHNGSSKLLIMFISVMFGGSYTRNVSNQMSLPSMDVRFEEGWSLDREREVNSMYGGKRTARKKREAELELL
ncbi:hypothetical protein WISP_19309 [Willisornis vidua]|uniref:Uncharacterized protein n=1 Tax=Willisornis vidua TaxID=1566151 RepID=A0ABQ9DNV7_9PASS|nr:hypothetical protein WISP_19309 [Willisornis vidua]